MKRNRDRAIAQGLVDCAVRAWEQGIDKMYVRPAQLNALLRVGATFYARNERGVGKLYHQKFGTWLKGLYAKQRNRSNSKAYILPFHIICHQEAS